MQINTNEQLAVRIENIISNIDLKDNNEVLMLFSGFIKNTLSHYYAINVLIEKQLYNSVFALVRVFFDSIVRGSYVVYIDKKVFEKSNFPRTEDMCKKLDDYFEANIFEKIRKNTYGMMCDYTHTGYNQIARCFNEEKCLIEPTFEDFLILDMLKGNYRLFELFAKNYIAFLKENELLQKEVVI